MTLRSTAFKIREAHGKDLSVILQLISANASTGKILRRSRKELRKVLRSFLVAEKDGEVVGCGALEIYNKKLAEIRSLAVAAEFQGKGIATALIKKLLETAKKKEVYEVLAITDRDRIFSRHGFSQQLHGQKALFLRP